MAYAYNDSGNYVSVPELAGNNTFSGVQKFVGNTASTSTSTGTVVITGGLGVQGNIYGSKVWGAVWNDISDMIEVPQDTVLEPGYCYCFDGTEYKKSNKYLADGFVGIHSDTAGFYIGKKSEGIKTLNTAVAGFVLAYVDKEYTPGTPLTCTKDGYLTELKKEDFALNSYKLIATFWKPEKNEKWGPEGKEVTVNNRMWVKIV